jgi:short-subunit dehydrogenase
MDRRLALVTGASAGIGAAFARILASHGYDVALTARRADRLEKLAEELSLRFGIEALSVAADLGEPEAPDQILDYLTAHGRTVDCLVNNAGYGLPGAYADTRWADQAAVIQVMVTAPAELAHRVLPGMRHRQYGRIVNVASLAGLAPGAAGAYALCRHQGVPDQVLPEPAPGMRGPGRARERALPGLHLFRVP